MENNTNQALEYKVLYRKYRPDDFSGIVGQEYMVKILKNAIVNDKISHAYIFSGPRGTGKTSTAKVFAKAINCMQPNEFGPCNNCESCLHFKENADIIEIDAASNNGVDEIREIINNIKIAPAYSKYKVYIIDEVHMLSTSAFNALLLTLEEPPKHVVFILATTNIEAVPITILSRCQRFDFHKISLTDIISRLKYVVSNEKINIDEEAIEEIAYISDGGLRDALSILDQLSSNTTNITLQDVISHFGSVSKKKIDDVYNLILTNNVNEFVLVMQNFKTLAIDYKLLIKKMLEKIEQEAIKAKTDNNYQGLSYQSLKSLCYDLANVSNYITLNVDPYLLIEITMLNYFPGNNLIQSNNQTEEIQTSKIEDKVIEKSNYEQESNQLSGPSEPLPENNFITKLNNDETLIKTRINNCFVNAKKDYLQLLKEDWDKFVTSISNKSLVSLMLDTQVVAASDKFAILSATLEGTANLINSQINELEQEYEEKYHKSYKMIAITNSRWLEEKQKYINNLKNKYEYQYINLPDTDNNQVKSEEPITNNIETVAYNLFDKDKIEIE